MAEEQWPGEAVGEYPGEAISTDLPEAKPDLITFYHPATPADTRAAGLSYAMEGGIHGAGAFSDMDLRNHTLEQYNAGKSDFVAVAMAGHPTGDEFALNLHGGPVWAKNVDTGGGLRMGQVDVATSNPQLAKTGTIRPTGRRVNLDTLTPVEVTPTEFLETRRATAVNPADEPWPGEKIVVPAAIKPRVGVPPLLAKPPEDIPSLDEQVVTAPEQYPGVPYLDEQVITPSTDVGEVPPLLSPQTGATQEQVSQQIAGYDEQARQAAAEAAHAYHPAPGFLPRSGTQIDQGDIREAAPFIEQMEGTPAAPAQLSDIKATDPALVKGAKATYNTLESFASGLTSLGGVTSLLVPFYGISKIGPSLLGLIPKLAEADKTAAGSPERYQAVSDTIATLATVGIFDALKPKDMGSISIGPPHPRTTTGSPAGPVAAPIVNPLLELADKQLALRTQAPTAETSITPQGDFIDVPFVKIGETGGTIGERVKQFLDAPDGSRPAQGLELAPHEPVPAPLVGYPVINHANGSRTIVNPAQQDEAQPSGPNGEHLIEVHPLELLRPDPAPAPDGTVTTPYIPAQQLELRLDGLNGQDKIDNAIAAEAPVGSPEQIQTQAQVLHDLESMGITEEERARLAGPHYVVANPVTGEIRDLMLTREQGLDYLRNTATPGETLIRRVEGQPDEVVARRPDDVVTQQDREIAKAKKATGKEELSGKDWDSTIKSGGTNIARFVRLVDGSEHQVAPFNPITPEGDIALDNGNSVSRDVVSHVLDENRNPIHTVEEPPPPGAGAPPFSERVRAKMGEKPPGGFAEDLGSWHEFGRQIYRAGMDFAHWSAQMLKRFGEAVREHLPGIWKSITDTIFPEKNIGGGIPIFGAKGVRETKGPIGAAIEAIRGKEIARVSSEQEFFGKVWPKMLRDTGLTTKDPMVAAARAVSDMGEWLRDNPKFKDYYEKDFKRSRQLMERGFGHKLTEPQFKLFRALNGIMSQATPLKANTRESLNGLKYFLDNGHLDGIKTGVVSGIDSAGRPYTARTLDPNNAFAIGGGAPAGVAFNVGILNNLIKRFGGGDKGISGAIKHLEEGVSTKELNAFNKEMGFKGDVGNIGAIRETVRFATGQSEKIPRAFIFGKKIGAYTLNNLGHYNYNTTDVWESRFLKSYFKGMLEKNPGIAGTADEHAIFQTFIEEFNRLWKEQVNPKDKSSALQAGRWFNIIEASTKAGYTRGLSNDVISKYVQEHFDEGQPLFAPGGKFSEKRGDAGIGVGTGEAAGGLPAITGSGRPGATGKLTLKPPKHPGGFIDVGAIAQAAKVAAERSRIKDVLLAREGATDNMSNVFSWQRSNLIRRDFGTVAQGMKKGTQAFRDLEALSLIEEAGFDKAELQRQRNLVVGAKHEKEFLPKYDYALREFNRIAANPGHYRSEMDAQLARENHAGITTQDRNSYVPHMYEEEPKGLFGNLFGTNKPGAGTGSARWFTKGRTFATLADAIEAGFRPKSLNAADLAQVRIRGGQRLIMQKYFRDKLKTMSYDGSPLAVDQPRRGYRTITINGVPVHVAEDLSRYVSMLFEPSAVRGSAFGRGAMTVVGTQKQLLLGADTFHAARLSLYNAGAGAGRTRFGFKRGLSVLELAPEDYNRAIASGEFSPAEVAYARQNRPLMLELLNQGANVAKWGDNIIGDLHRVMPGLRGLNSFIFDSIGRGSLMQGLLANYKRVLSRFPELSRDQAARKAVVEMNEMFGNQGRRSIFKSRTFQDLGQFLLLARNWVESQFKSEIRAYGQMASYPYQVGKGLYQGQGIGSFGRLGVTAQSRLSLALGLFVAGQILNYALNKKSTFDNEEGHKIDVKIPKGFLGLSKNYYFDPSQIPFEFTHQTLKYMRKGESLLGAGTHIALNKLANLPRAALAAFGQAPYRGAPVAKPGIERARQVATSIVSPPITTSGFIEPEPRSPWLFRLNRRPDAKMLQGAASLGIKLEPEEAARDKVYSMVREKGFQKPDEQIVAGKYSQFKRALNEGDARAAKEEFGMLMKEAPTRADKMKMLKGIKESLGVRTQGGMEKYPERGSTNPQLFTGNVKDEVKFKRTLNPQERMTYDEAQRDHKQAARFFKMLQPQLRMEMQ